MSVTVWIRADRCDGNDPFEAEAVLPIVPRKGDAIEVEHPSGTDFLQVVDVVIPVVQRASPLPWMPEPTMVQVWVRLDGYDLDFLSHIMGALKSGYAAGADMLAAEHVALALQDYFTNTTGLGDGDAQDRVAAIMEGIRARA